MDFMSVIQQYLAPLVQWFAALFTPAEWKLFVVNGWRFLLLLGLTLAATHTIKVLWRKSHWRGGGHGHTNVVALVVSYPLAFLVWKEGSSFAIPAILGGPSAILTFKVAFAWLKRKHPELAAEINFDRRGTDRGSAARRAHYKDEKQERTTDSKYK